MSAATRVDLLRHGEAEGGRRLRGAATDDPLTPQGRDDMLRAIRREGPWDAIVSSPLRRCIEVAREAAAELDRPLAEEARFAEYDFGDWSGRALDALWAEQGDALAAFFADPGRVTPPGGETAAAFRGRVRAAWADVLEREAGRRVLVIAHGGVLRQLLADAIGATGSIFATLEWPNAALSRLRVFDEPAHGRRVTLAFHARQYPPSSSAVPD